MGGQKRIAIVGAGAAGLSAALYLRDRGYAHVTVFEASERIGGKCRSLTYDGRSFDLGANYITSSYRRVRAMARRFGMRMFTEAGGHAVNPETGELRSILSATTQGQSLLAIAWDSLRYLWLRWRLRHVLAPAAPGYATASTQPALMRPLAQWLEENGLRALEPMFNIPVTLMGYSRLSQIPAAYALTYMNPGTFIDLVLFALNPPLRRWPKRFTLGYERLLERMAAEVDVLRGAKIERIQRGDQVRIAYRLAGADLLRESGEARQASFDALILACPLSLEVLEPMLELSAEETALFSKIELDPFVVATYATACRTPVHAVSFAFPRPDVGQPYVVTRQFSEVPLLSIYSRVDRAGRISRDDVLESNRAFLRRIGAENPDAVPYSFDEWPYFPHMDSAAMSEGCYIRLEALQGAQRTWYTGGLLAFELVETIFEYSRHLVDTHFPRPS